MELTRRDLLKASGAVAAAMGLEGSGLLQMQEALGLEAASGGLQVIWLQGQTCTGCSVSLLNSIYYATIDNLLTNTLDMNFHPNLMAAAGSTAVAAADEAYNRGNYVLAIEGAIPTGASGQYCTTWHGMTMQQAVTRYASRARYVLAVGTCASFGGVCAGTPNPTGARPVSTLVTTKPVINIPGCPMHPDWVVGTIAYLLKYKAVPTLDSYKRPMDYFRTKIHDRCPLKGTGEVKNLSQQGCLKALGCKGPRTKADCMIRKWNSGGTNQYGYNWCLGAGAPCVGCTEPLFPDGMSPFYKFPA